ncbi:hypothetical protein ACL02U_10900 [Streptomyces sp. MS06]|uniref:hypothetical protein n=1 Tax=Streptomyces sp. MS06 TaxID=3385974 RepID=UPI00399F40DA
MSPRARHRGRGAAPGRRAAAPARNPADIVRLARAGLFAAVCAVTTALGHTLMSGRVLPWWAAGLALAAAGTGGWWLTGRERAAATVVGTTVAAQVLLHLLFASASRSANRAGPPAAVPGSRADCCSGTPVTTLSPAGVTPSPARTALRHSSAVGDAGAPAGLPDLPLTAAVPHDGSGGMLLAHVLAAVVCGLWLWRGEAAAHRLGRTLAAVLFAPLRRILRALLAPRGGTGAPPRRVTRQDGKRRRPAASALRHVVVRRGPPGRRSTARCPALAPLPAARS